MVKVMKSLKDAEIPEARKIAAKAARSVLEQAIADQGSYLVIIVEETAEGKRQCKVGGIPSIEDMQLMSMSLDKIIEQALFEGILNESGIGGILRAIFGVPEKGAGLPPDSEGTNKPK